MHELYVGAYSVLKFPSARLFVDTQTGAGSIPDDVMPDAADS